MLANRIADSADQPPLCRSGYPLLPQSLRRVALTVHAGLRLRTESWWRDG